jgi:hypothetical protein
MTTTMKQMTFSMAFAGACFALFLALPSASHAAEIGAKRMMMTNSSSTASSTKPVVNLSCVQEAVLARETAVTTSWTAFNTSVVAALTKRTEGLVAAWKVTDVKDRSADLKDVWATWKTDSRTAHTALKAGRKTAWTDFKTTMTTKCKTTRLPIEDGVPRDTTGAVTI